MFSLKVANALVQYQLIPTGCIKEIFFNQMVIQFSFFLLIKTVFYWIAQRKNTYLDSHFAMYVWQYYIALSLLTKVTLSNTPEPKKYPVIYNVYKCYEPAQWINITHNVKSVPVHRQCRQHYFLLIRNLSLWLPR